MSKRKYVIFDLDQTLVDSECLKKFRDAHDWESAMRGVSSLTLYDGVSEMLANLRRANCKIGVLTNSPRNYCEAVCESLGLEFDAMVCFHDVEYAKPNPEGMRQVLARLAGYTGDSDPKEVVRFVNSNKLFFEAIAVGDAWSDIVAARSASKIPSIGALWGSSDKDELVSSNPTYFAETVPELSRLLEQLRAESYPLYAENDTAQKRYDAGLWKLVKNEFGERRNLRDGQEYYYARMRWNGGWMTSYGNETVSGLKNLESSFLKDRAVEKFAVELDLLLSDGASICFQPSSKKPGHPEYDDRWERLERALKQIRPDVTVLTPIRLVQSLEKASTSKDPSLRDPNVIIQNFQWAGLQRCPAEVFIVDDVLTSGGHFEASIRIWEKNCPGTKITGAFWSIHMGDRL